MVILDTNNVSSVRINQWDWSDDISSDGMFGSDDRFSLDDTDLDHVGIREGKL